MAWNGRDGNGTLWKVWALTLAAGSFSGSVRASDFAPPGTCPDKRCVNGCIGHKPVVDTPSKVMGAGPLGYGPPGIHPGFQGFGLGYHLGYGYGGQALGTAQGGFPFYGGPGYPHLGPTLRRIGGITPFPHDSGPGFPTPEHPNYYGEPGALVVDEPVVSTTGGHYDSDVANSFGSFTGAIPYPESTFAPFTSGTGGTPLDTNPTAASPSIVPTQDQRPVEPLRPSSRHDLRPGSIPTDRELGFDQETMIGLNSRGGMRVIRVYPGTEAAKSGLQAGDIIESINEYANTKPGHLAWIIVNAAPDRMLRMKVLTPNLGEEKTIAIPLDQEIAGGRTPSDTTLR